MTSQQNQAQQQANRSRRSQSTLYIVRCELEKADRHCGRLSQKESAKLHVGEFPILWQRPLSFATRKLRSGRIARVGRLSLRRVRSPLGRLWNTRRAVSLFHGVLNILSALTGRGCHRSPAGTATTTVATARPGQQPEHAHRNEFSILMENAHDSHFLSPFALKTGHHGQSTGHLKPRCGRTTGYIASFTIPLNGSHPHEPPDAIV